MLPTDWEDWIILNELPAPVRQALNDAPVKYTARSCRDYLAAGYTIEQVIEAIMEVPRRHAG